MYDLSSLSRATLGLLFIVVNSFELGLECILNVHSEKGGRLLRSQLEVMDAYLILSFSSVASETSLPTIAPEDDFQVVNYVAGLISACRHGKRQVETFELQSW